MTTGYRAEDGPLLQLSQIQKDTIIHAWQIMTAHVEAVNRANGWFDADRTFGDDIALLHSEVSEAFEGYRNHDMANVREELADVLIRLIDTGFRINGGIGIEFINKMEKNAKRGYKHGGKAV